MRKGALKKLLSPRFMCSEILDVHRQVERMVRETPNAAFRTYWVNTAKGMKPLAAVDFMAEKSFESSINHTFGTDSVLVIGEESLDSADLESENRICILVDMIDGTDLLQRGFANWCSAVIVFAPQPKPPRILASFVAVKGEALYFANEHGAYRWPLRRRVTQGVSRLFIPRVNQGLKDATVCMYAQKGSRLLGLLSLHKTGLPAWLEGLKTGDRALKRNVNRSPDNLESTFRFYDLAGNPMMCRMLTGKVAIVFDLEGQSPHDVVPGAFISLKGGASFCTPAGVPITESQLAETLLRPGVSDLKYVLASTEELSQEFRQVLALSDPS
jgi:fructose-1,6-bisphosphatase/inositol monophosphatase family enzyme